MKFKAYYEHLDAAGKKALADKLDTSVPYLSQLAYGHRNAGASILLKIESATGGQVTPQEMRTENAA